jgi:hypothetical protein
LQIFALADQIAHEEMEANSRRTGRPLVNNGDQMSIPLDHHPDWYYEEAARRLGYKLTRVGSMTCSGGAAQRPQKARTTFLERLRHLLFGDRG